MDEVWQSRYIDYLEGIQTMVRETELKHKTCHICYDRNMDKYFGVTLMLEMAYLKHKM